MMPSQAKDLKIQSNESKKLHKQVFAIVFFLFHLQFLFRNQPPEGQALGFIDKHGVQKALDPVTRKT